MPIGVRAAKRGLPPIPAFGIGWLYPVCPWLILRHARSSARVSVLVLYVMYNVMRFEWDADKNQSNQKKHAGIDFETASRVFADPNLMLRKDRVVR